MKNLSLYQVLGYAGVMPFLVATLVMVFVKAPSVIALAAMVQIAYGGLILSFLSGVQWAHALPKGDKSLMGLAMVPSVVSLALIVWALMSYNFVIPLLVLAIGFIGMYVIDGKYLEREWLPAGYFVFRKHLSVIVFTCLIVSAATFWF